LERSVGTVVKSVFLATDCTRLSGPPPSGNRRGMYSGYLFPGKSKA